MTTGYKIDVPNVTMCAQGGIAVSSSDSNELSPYSRALYVGTSGDVKVTHLDGSVAVYPAVPAGMVLPVSCKLVWSTGTTASNIVNMY